MKAILKTSVFLAVLVACTSADCSSYCGSFCNVISAACGVNVIGQSFGLNCTAISEGCTATCNAQCTCVEAAMGVCATGREGCRTSSGYVDFVCQMEYNACVTAGIASCVEEVGANTVAYILQLVSQTFLGFAGTGDMGDGAR